MRKFLIGLFGYAGVMHFVRPHNFDKLVPESLPGTPRQWTYGSGAAELATATLLAIPATRKAGGWATVVLMLAVWPGNFYMAYQWNKQQRPWWQQAIAIGRLPLQLPLIRAGWRLRK